MAQTTVKVYLTGKLGSMVYTPNRQGTAVRTLVTPKNPKTAAQTAQRSRLAAAAKAWSALAAAARTSWKNLISSFPNNLSAFNIFVKVAVTAAECGDNAPTVAPALPAIGLPTFGSPPLAGTVSTSTGAVTLTCTPSLTPAPDHYIYRASKPVSAGVASTPQMEVILIVAGASPASASALGAAYTTKFGTPVAGKQVFLQVIPVKSSFQGTSQVFSAVLTSIA
jgi:hypothetical protein